VAVVILGGLTASFCAGAASDETWTRLQCRGKDGATFYPPMARQRHESGAVLLEYSVNTTGLTERIVVLKSTAPESLHKAAIRLLSQLRCTPDVEWVNGGGPQRRLRINVLFQFIDEEVTKPIDAEAVIIAVSTASSIRKKLW
jgi:TonB family protein